jgi:hypothetical protein
MPRPGPYSHAYRGRPAPLNLPPISQLNTLPVNHPPTNYSHRYLPAPQLLPNIQTHPIHTHNAAGFQGAGSTSNAPSPAPAVTMGSHNLALIHGGDRRVGKVDHTQLWINRHLLDLEVFSRKESGDEKGKVFLGLWLGTREMGLRDRQNVRFFIAKNLMPYPWFEGDETISEALRALHRLQFINLGLLAKKHAENANWFLDMKMGDMTVREYWLEEAKKQPRYEQTQAHAQAQAQAQAEC